MGTITASSSSPLEDRAIHDTRAFHPLLRFLTVDRPNMLKVELPKRQAGIMMGGRGKPHQTT